MPIPSKMTLVTFFMQQTLCIFTHCVKKILIDFDLIRICIIDSSLSKEFKIHSFEIPINQQKD